MQKVVDQLRLENVSLAPKLFAQEAVDGSTRVPFLLKEISFTVQPGDRLALVGASGSGKTLLLRLLNRLQEPTRGKLYWEGRPYSQIAPVQLRHQIVLVLQESKLLGMNVQEALSYPLRLRHLPERVIQQRLQDWLERLEIPKAWLDRNELQLSVGQRQWIALARALILQPKVLLLDEPTSALDLGRSYQIVRVLQELATTQMMTVLMANHQLEVAEAFCDRLLHLSEGQLVQNAEATTVNWKDLRDRLLELQTKQAEEWGD